MEHLPSEIKRLNRTHVPIYIKNNKFIGQFMSIVEKLGLIVILKQKQHEMLIMKTADYKHIELTKNIPIRCEQLSVIDTPMILSTVKGLATNLDCVKNKIGGKILAVVKS